MSAASEEHRPAIIVSTDSHISPRGVDLRPYCPADHVDGFEAWRQHEMEASPYRFPTPYHGSIRRHELNIRTEGHHDIEAHLADMDGDGVAASLIFHGSQNQEPFPFGITGVVDHRTELADAERTAVGIRMYNRWLADACSVQPERNVGLAHVPMWDVDLVVAEIEWAHAAGLRGVNWPAPKPWIVEYDHPMWEPVWEVASRLQMPLVTHTGAIVQGHLATEQDNSRPQSFPIIHLEACGWPSRRGLGRMVLCGAFERHPDLRVVMVEQPGVWWEHVTYELDCAWRQGIPALHEMVPRLPSEYCRERLFVGASFLSHYEAEVAIEQGYDANYMWGSDYPHREGTWAFPEDGVPNRTRLALHDTFTGLPPDRVRAMLGTTAIDLFGLDGAALQAVADAVAAPSVADLVGPLDDDELRAIDRFRDREVDFTLAFRRRGE